MTGQAYLPDTGDLIRTDSTRPRAANRPAGGRPCGFSCRVHREHRSGDRMSDHIARRAIPDKRRSPFELADRRRDPDQPYPQHRHSGPAHPLCGRRRAGRDRPASPGEARHVYHDLK